MSLQSVKDVGRDLSAGLVVFLVALPLCLGVALASDAPLASGLVAGIIGGLVVGALSGSQTSVAGPAAGLTAVVAAQIAGLGSFSAFLVAVVLAGVIQIGLGIARAGDIASFFPSSVIKGLLAAIGIILILKQLPHLVGHDNDAEGEMQFNQPDGENSFTELAAALFDIQPGAAIIGFSSIALLWGWGRIQLLKKSPVPAPLIVVVLGFLANELLLRTGSPWALRETHLVQVPVSDGLASAGQLLAFPDWSTLGNASVYVAAITIAIVASLETLLNLDAVDQIDPQQRRSPPNRELLAQGVGNVTAGLLGGIPVTSVIVRSSVNIAAGNKTKLSTISHGALLVLSVLFIPGLINGIPLAALAAILFMTGLKLATPALFRRMWSEGRQQFLPFIATVVLIVVTDLLVGVLLGLGVALAFILRSNFRRPIRTIQESLLGGDVFRVELANQVSFLNRAALDRTLREIPEGGHVLIDARHTDYMDPDILDLILEFRDKGAPAHGVQVSLLGFDDQPRVDDDIRYVDHATAELQSEAGPAEVLQILERGNERFRNGERLLRDFRRQMLATAPAQAPLAVVLSCIDSRAPTEHIFDLGIGDIFSVRMAGNVAKEKVLGSIEYSCKVAGAKLIVVMGHTRCGAVTSAVDLALRRCRASEATGCQHLDSVISEIQQAIPSDLEAEMGEVSKPLDKLVDDVARLNVLRTMTVIREQSSTIAQLLSEGRVHIVGAVYDVESGEIEWLDDSGVAEPVHGVSSMPVLGERLQPS